MSTVGPINTGSAFNRTRKHFVLRCLSGHTWKAYGDLCLDNRLFSDKMVLVLSLESLFDLSCPNSYCHKLGSVLLPNPHAHEIYCFTVCKRCGKRTFAFMTRDTEREMRDEQLQRQFCYRLAHVVPLLCASCVVKIKEQEHNEVAS